MRYFKRYIERMLYGGRMRRVWKPIRGWVETKKRPLYFDENRMWTTQFRKNNEIVWSKHRKRFIESIHVEKIKNWNIFNGDRVMIMTGKDEGKIGIVNCIIKERNWVFVESLNLRREITSDVSGKRVLVDERPLLYPYQVKLVDPFDSLPTEVKWVYDKNGVKIRISDKSGIEIPLPVEATMTEDFVLPQEYTENPVKDTKNYQLSKITYKPNLKTFEQDLMEHYNIKEDRKKQKTYWY
ncbi:hypothetical protein A3Q56_02093 [Intoshia linei]|uniref:Large ribosomal subunit protein uL24m n=1 Tax=Intoshia linei TaxID=1819745 RepID=A0A177B7D8_9BILA|nr:hypothetical protein A3Q56_02093 [Intoshia linei]